MNPIFSSNNRISARQLQALLILTLSGASVVRLPKTLAMITGRDGWLCIPVAGTAAALFCVLISLFFAKAPGKGFFERSAGLLSRPAAYVLCVLLAVRLMIASALELRMFGELTRAALLPKTPLWLTMPVMLGISVYAAYKGLETIGRLAEIIFALFFVFFVCFAVNNIFNVSSLDFSRLMPLLHSPPMKVAEGSIAAGSAFTGIELLLFITPYVNAGSDTAGLRLGIIKAVLISVIILTLTCVITFAYMSPEGAASRTWPLLDLLETSRLSGTFWIITSFVKISAYLYASWALLREMIRKGRRAYYIIPVAAIALIIACCTGCRDKAELEDRAFAGTISFDVNGAEGFRAGAELLIFNENINESKDKTGGERDILSAEGAVPAQALRELSRHSSKVLSYSLSKSCLFGEELLKDSEKLKAVVESLRASPEITGKAAVLAARGPAADVLKYGIPDAASVDMYLTEYLHKRGLVKTNLEQLSLALSGQGGAVIGLFDNGEAGPEFPGAAVISGGKLAGFVSNRELRGFIWANAAKDALIVSNAEDGAALFVNGINVSTEFGGEDGTLKCTMYITVRGGGDRDIGGLEAAFARIVEEETELTHNTVAGYGADAYGLEEKLRAANPDLYKQYGGDVSNIVFNAKAEVEICE
ncbi:MAG: endospore germination permease [Clostridiales bacterium]|nr:endospore germination permease [Clostridiales bacterium]